MNSKPKLLENLASMNLNKPLLMMTAVLHHFVASLLSKNIKD